MKKFIFAAALLLLFIVPAWADNAIQVYVNGKYVGDGIEIDGKTYVPITMVAEGLDAKVDWDGTVQVTDWGPLTRPEVSGEPEFIEKVGQALDLLEQKDYPHYAMICQLGWPIERRAKSPISDTAAGSIEKGYIVIYDYLVNDPKWYVPEYLAGLIVHEASHGTSNKHENWNEINHSGLSERVAYEQELAALKLLGAPQWMQDSCIGWEKRYKNLD